MNKEIERIKKIESFEEKDGIVIYRDREIVGKIPLNTQNLIDSKANEESVLKADGSRPMTGLLTLSGAPSANLHAATKKYVDDIGGDHTHTLDAGATDVTAIAAEVNLLDLSGLSIGQVLRATGAASAAWGNIQNGDLPTGIDAAKIADGSVSSTEYQYLNGVTSALQTQLNAKAADSIILKKDGTIALTANWDIGDSRKIIADEIRARDGDGLKLFNSSEAGLTIHSSGAKLPADSYLNWETVEGAPGFGIRSNSGVMEYKNSGGAWQNFLATPGGSPGVFNVLDYGAVADGVTDDTAAFQATITAAPAKSIIYIPFGNYYISDELLVTKNLFFIGDGVGTMIYQSSTTKNLFYCTCTGQVTFANMKLGSEATTAGKCLIRLDEPVSHVIIRNVFLIGGYYGIGFYGGGIFGLLEHVCNTTVFYRSVSATNQCWIHGERQAPKSNNAFLLSHLILQGGTAGVYFDDSNSEGTMIIVGGCYESFTTGPAIYIEGYVLGVTITGIHNEGGADSKLELSGCRNVSLAGSFVQSLTMTGCRNVTVQNCHLWGIITSVIIDDTSSDITLLDSWYTAALDITAKHVFKSGLTKVLAPAFRGSGMFMGRSGFSNLVDGLFEAWDDAGNPLGFYAAPSGSLAKETTTVRFGTTAVKIVVPAAQTKAYLMYAMDAAKYDRSKTFFPNIFTVSFWAWKPTGVGYNPFVKISYDSGSTSYDTFTLADENWTYCQVSLELSGAAGYDNPILQIGVASGVTEGDYIIIDGLTIIEGDHAPITFDDSRGKEGNFRVAGNSLRGGKTKILAGNGSFTYGDGELHIIDPGGASRNYDPSGAFPERAEIWIINTADAAETITVDSGGIAQAVAQNERGYFIYSGSAWIKVYVN